MFLARSVLSNWCLSSLRVSRRSGEGHFKIRKYQPNDYRHTLWTIRGALSKSSKFCVFFCTAKQNQPTEPTESSNTPPINQESLKKTNNEHEPQKSHKEEEDKYNEENVYGEEDEHEDYDYDEDGYDEDDEYGDDEYGEDEYGEDDEYGEVDEELDENARENNEQLNFHIQTEIPKTVPELPKTDQEFFEYLRKPLYENDFFLKPHTFEQIEKELERKMTHQSKDTQVTESDAATQKKEKEVDKNLTKETTSEEQDTQKLTQQSFDLPKRPTTEAIFTALFGPKEEEEKKEKEEEEEQKQQQKAAETKDDILLEQFESTFKSKRKSLEELVYWDLYPTQVKRWLMYTKSPKGRYNDEGRWTADHQLLSSKEPFNFTLPYEKNQEDWDKWEAIFKREQEQLPEHLRNVFRFGVTAEELSKVHPRLRRIFSLRNAPQREITSALKQQAIKKWQLHDGDTGSSQVQIAMLTIRINNLIEHLRIHHKDTDNKYRLQLLIKRRRGLLRHLKKNDIATYYALLQDLGLRDSVQIY